VYCVGYVRPPKTLYPEPLAKLPEPEQAACRKLWADVEALLKKAQEAKK
jgi:hypothetical protein